MDILITALVGTLLFFVAFIYSNLGMGGGGLYVPILLTWITSLKEIAVPMSLAFTIATALPATYNHYREGLVNARLAFVLVGGALIGAVAGALFTLASSRELFLALFSTVLTLVGLKMLRDWYRRVETIEQSDDSRMTRHRLVSASTATLSSGFLSGSMGIGGGVANVPIMAYILGRRTRLAIGTSTMMIIPISGVGLASYLLAGFLGFGGSTLDVGLLAIFCPIVLVGSFLGSYWGLRALRARSVALAFILVLFVAAGKMLFDLAQGLLLTG